MSGRYQGFTDAARQFVKAMDPYTLARQVPSAELYGFTPIATLLRFEKLDAVLAEPPPPKTLLIDRSFSLYARGVAFAAKGQLKDAEAARGELDAVIAVSDFGRYTANDIQAKTMAALEPETAGRRDRPGQGRQGWVDR